MNEDYRALVNIASEATRLAGTFCRNEFGRVSPRDHRKKGTNDFFTYVDVQSEEIIIDHIRKYYPSHTILAEESGLSTAETTNEYVWHIDPVDGTNNYIHKIPFYAVSIGISYQDQLIGGVIYAPEQNEMFTASYGAGAFLNNRRIRVSNASELSESTFSFGFPHRGKNETVKKFNIVSPLLVSAGAVRRCGSAALDLAWLASGRFDACIELGMQKHDIAAGIVIAREAGALVSGPDGEDGCFATGNVLAASEGVHRQILRMLRPDHPDR